MAYIDEMQELTAPVVTETSGRIIKSVLAKAAWSFYRQYSEQVILTKKFVFFTFKLKVRDLRGAFEQIFGPEPV